MSLCIHRKKKSQFFAIHYFSNFLLILSLRKKYKYLIFPIFSIHCMQANNRPLKSQSIVFIFSNPKIVLEQHILMKDKFFFASDFLLYYLNFISMSQCVPTHQKLQHIKPWDSVILY